MTYSYINFRQNSAIFDLSNPQKKVSFHVIQNSPFRVDVCE